MSNEKASAKIKRRSKRQHHFMLTVTGDSSKEGARIAVLAAFASRMPDGLSFHLKGNAEQKEAWMDGAKAGTEIAYDLILKALMNMRDQLGIAARKEAP